MIKALVCAWAGRVIGFFKQLSHNVHDIHRLKLLWNLLMCGGGYGKNRRFFTRIFGMFSEGGDRGWGGWGGNKKLVKSIKKQCTCPSNFLLES